MSADVMDDDKFVSVDERAWHPLGYHFDHDMSAVDGWNAMGGGFEMYKKPVGVMLTDEFLEVPGHCAIVRGPSNKDNRNIVFDYVTDNYNIVQPYDLVKKFDEKVGISISSMGFLQEGRKQFITWKLKMMDIIAGDEVQLYGNLLMGTDSKFSAMVSVLMTRTVCLNTFKSAIAESEEEDKSGRNRGRGTVYAGRHNNPNLLEDLGEWMGFVQDNVEKRTQSLTNLFRGFASTPIIHEKQAIDLIGDTWTLPNPVPNDYPEALREKAEKKVEAEIKKVERIREGVFDAFNTNAFDVSTDPTLWKLFNAGTWYFNHGVGGNRDASYSILYGDRNAQMNRFAQVLKDSMAK